MPDPPSPNLPMILMSKLTAFHHNIKSHIDGGDMQYPLQKYWTRLVSDFSKTLANSRPALVLRDASESPQKVSQSARSQQGEGTPTPSTRQTPARPSIVVSDSDDEDHGKNGEVFKTPTKRSRIVPATKSVTSTPSKRLKMQDIPLHATSNGKHLRNSNNAITF